MGKAEFKSAYFWEKKVSVSLIINGKEMEICDIPASNELIKELTRLFKQHLPKVEDI